jgi:hypothetical protein
MNTSTTSRIGKPDNLKCQTGPSGFPGDSSSWSPARARSVEGWIFYWSIRGSPEKIGPRSETSASDEVKPNAEKSLEEVAAEQDRVSEA